ncbi:proteasome complex subunit Rpn13 ubiquitin receptor-domain-containing protein [Aspergillus cavernicola]|uniref:Proteasome complex subunit Rpn13 ubiquitin receptor-domain-containing protein n=1 Tax=Aspergillus cavernicola TaxID=176166 RepID=A0ABR4HWB7_9EURO
MSIAPIITFKAGICDLETTPTGIRARPQQTPGYIYLYSEDELIHFCWRPRNAPHTQPELDLVMVPSDGTFTPYRSDGKPTDGRIFVLKFSSSSQRYLFWLQSKSQHDESDPAFWSERDTKLGWIVNQLLQGEEFDVEQEVAAIPKGRGPSNNDDDETMEDVEGVDHDPNHNHGGTSGGAGPAATGGDVREEGQESRQGGGDGGRAATASSDPSAVVQDFLKSLRGNQSQEAEQPFTTLQDLLPPSATLPLLETLDAEGVDNLLKFLPQELLVLALQMEDQSAVQGRPETAQEVLGALNLSQKKNILRKILHSPQFTQSLASLTVAIRDGGLPSISEALKIPVENGGFMRRGGVPLGGGDAVKAFLQGVRNHVRDSTQGNRMETD